MRKITVGKHRHREVDVPSTWDEGYMMVDDALNELIAGRINDATAASVGERVLFGMYGERYNAPNQRMAFLYFLLDLCKKSGGGI